MPSPLLLFAVVLLFVLFWACTEPEDVLLVSEDEWAHRFTQRCRMGGMDREQADAQLAEALDLGCYREWNDDPEACADYNATLWRDDGEPT